MAKSTLKVRRPFQNLKFLINFNKALGLVACKLIDGRLKQNTIWNRYWCILWILFHCGYSSFFYYGMYMASPDEKAKTGFMLGIVRYTAFFISLLPYHLLVIFQDRNFVKFSDKLETYDDKARILGHERQDKHVFLWLYFVYISVTITMKLYYNISYSIEDEALLFIMGVLEDIIPATVGAYCVFITCVYLDLIRQRFRHLNEIIVPHVSELPVTGARGEITVYDVRYMHGVLIDSAEEIDSLYGIGTLFTFASILLEFVAVIYLFIIDAKEDNATVIMLDLLFQVIFLFSMYHFTTYEANRVEDRTIKYGLSFQNAKCRMDKIEMMLYFYHTRFAFTAAEFFDLDLTIFVSIASAVTTYVTLII